jgi:hypothetical protein
MGQLGNGNCNTSATPPTLVLQNSSPKVNSNAWEQRINLIHHLQVTSQCGYHFAFTPMIPQIATYLSAGKYHK